MNYHNCIIHFKACPVGPEPNLLDPDVSDCPRVYLEHPILSNADVQAIKESGLSWCKVCTHNLQIANLFEL